MLTKQAFPTLLGFKMPACNIMNGQKLWNQIGLTPLLLNGMDLGRKLNLSESQCPLCNWEEHPSQSADLAQ